MSESDLRIYVLNTLEVGLDTLSGLQAGGVPLQGVIGLTERARSDKISGYLYMEDECRRLGLDFVGVDRYSLRGATDRRRLEELEIDLLVLGGWQRLIPNWLIEHCRIAALGSHGSPWGITGGRGRSPQNWALIMGLEEFWLSVFKVDAGIDSGEVIGKGRFELTVHDDIRSSYAKACRVATRVVAEAVQRGSFVGEPQASEGAHYLPQRLPEDGALDWRRDSKGIYDTLRALTRPYPGAFSLVEGERLVAWRGKPLESGVQAGRPGEVVQVLHGGELVIQTGDGLFMLDDYDFSGGAVQPGLVLSSTSYRAQLEQIFARHRAKHPKLPIAPKLIEYAEAQTT